MHPILFYVSGDFFIGPYGLLIALGLAGACGLAAWRGKKQGIAPEFFVDMLFIVSVLGFLGARILYIALNFKEFLADPVGLLLSRTGFVFLGGLVAGVAAGTWFVFRRGIEFWRIADIVGPSICVGHAFGRIGCHFAGCCFGGVCTAPWAIQVPRVTMRDGSPWPNAWQEQLHQGLLGPDALVSLPVWPVQLMESVGLAILCGLLLFAARNPTRKGVQFSFYLMGYSLLRFGLEFLRGDVERGVFGAFGFSLSTSQIISLVLFGVGAVILFTARKREIQESTSPVSGLALTEEEAGVALRRRRRARG